MDPIDQLCHAYDESSQRKKTSPSAKANDTNGIWVTRIVSKIRDIVTNVRCPACTASISRSQRDKKHFKCPECVA